MIKYDLRPVAGTHHYVSNKLTQSSNFPVDVNERIFFCITFIDLKVEY